MEKVRREREGGLWPAHEVVQPDVRPGSHAPENHSAHAGLGREPHAAHWQAESGAGGIESQEPGSSNWLTLVGSSRCGHVWAQGLEAKLIDSGVDKYGFKVNQKAETR